MVVLVAAAATTKYFHDKNEKLRRESAPMQQSAVIANLQPELSPPPPDEMWAQKSPTPSRRGMQMMERPQPDTTSGGALPAGPSPTPTATPDRVPAAGPLMRDREQLRRQIAELDRAQLDQQIAQRNEELIQLHNQLNQYSTALQNLDQAQIQRMEFRQILNQTRLIELDDRIRVQERIIASTQQQQAAVTLNPLMYEPGSLQALQAQQTAQEQQMQNLLAQRSTISTQAMQEMEAMNQQTLGNRASLEAARAAVQSQIRFTEQDLTRLSQERTNSEALREQYQREASAIDQQLRSMGVNPGQNGNGQNARRTITFP